MMDRDPTREPPIETLLEFIRQHPTRPLDAQSARWVIERIGLEHGRLLVLRDQQRIQLVAALFAEMDNPNDAAELFVLGYRPSPAGPGELVESLRWAEPVARATNARQLEIALPGTLGRLEPTVRDAGYQLAYQLLTMVLDPIGDSACLHARPPSGCVWVDLAQDNVASAHECYGRAFASTSGTQVPSLETFRTTMLSAEQAPRVLLDGARVIAFARTTWFDETARRGEVRLIARHPTAAQPRLGTAALAEALRSLAARGATSAYLEVASDNERAVRLYARCGFQLEQRYPVYRRAL